MEMESPDGVQWLVGRYQIRDRLFLAGTGLLPRVLESNNWEMLPKA